MSLERVVILKARPAFISLVSQVAGEPVAGGAASSISVTSHHHPGLSVHAAAKGKDDRVELAGRGGSMMQILQQSSVVKKGMPRPISQTSRNRGAGS